MVFHVFFFIWDMKSNSNNNKKHESNPLFNSKSVQNMNSKFQASKKEKTNVKFSGVSMPEIKTTIELTWTIC